MMGYPKKRWSKEAYERQWLRLLAQMNNPDTFNSYENKQKNLNKIKDDFPRY